MGKIITKCPKGHVTTSRCRCPGDEVTHRQATGCGTYCSKEFPAEVQTKALWDAILTVYNRHDGNRPLNHVNVVEWVEAVEKAGFKLVAK
jgi:hypothetical protein